MVTVSLLDDALRRGLRLHFDHAGVLRVSGPRKAEKTALALVEHRPLLARWLQDGRVGLDWRNQPLLFHSQGCLLCCGVRDDHDRHPPNCLNCGPAWDRRRPDPCRYCRHTAHFVYDGAPVHKACVEAEVWRRLVELRDRRAAA